VNSQLSHLGSELSEFIKAPGLREVGVELARLKEMLQSEFPHARGISFEYENFLRVNIDVRNRDEVGQVEGKLSILGGGIFRDIRRGSKPRHPFMQRVTAVVSC